MQRRGKDERQECANRRAQVARALLVGHNHNRPVASSLHFNETMASDSAADIVRTEALWFEPTSDGMAPLLEDEFYQARAELPSVDLPDTYPSWM